MKIVLKNGDFSQSGIPTPHEVVFDGSKYINVFTGALEANSNTQRGADTAKIPMSNNKIVNKSAATIFTVLFYDSQDNCLGIVSRNGTESIIILDVNGSIRIDQAAHYVRYSGTGTTFVEMTQQEVTQMLANASYWMIAAQCLQGIDAVQVTLDIE